MKSNGAKVFMALAFAVIAFAFYDYKNSAQVESDKLVANRVFPNRLVEDIEEFKIHSIFGDVTVQNTNGKWNVTAPIKDSADELTVMTYLNTLLNQETKKVETETESDVDWSQYGLDKPDAWTEVTFKDKEHVLIQAGSVRAVSDGHYLRRNKDKTLLVGAAEWTGILNRPPGEFRNKSLFDLSEPVTEFSIDQKPGLLSAKLNAGKWGDLDTQKVNDFLTVVGNFKADLIASDDKLNLTPYGLHRPLLEVILKSGNEHRIVTFGRGTNGKIYAVSTARTAVFELTEEKLAALKRTAKDFKNEPAVKPEKKEK